MWPIQLHFLLLIVVLISSCFFLPELFICYFVRPPYLKDVSEAAVDEDLEFVVEKLSSFPRFTAIEKNWFNVGVENAYLSVYG